MKVNKEWINISDMMSGLMMVFLFIAISFMVEVENDKKRVEQDRNQAEHLAEKYKKSQYKAEKLAEKYKKSQDSIKEIVMTYRKSQQTLNNDLIIEFKKDLKKWGAEITKENIFRFNSPEVLFKTGSSRISEKFKKILDNFFPRYVNLLTSQKYIYDIDEIRIEGHTSNKWGKAKSKEEIYLKNMLLSQNRANNVLTYCYKIDNHIIQKNKEWLEKKFRANGMAFSKLIYQENGYQDFDKSRRVEFRVLTKAQEKIYKIIEELKSNK